MNNYSAKSYKLAIVSLILFLVLYIYFLLFFRPLYDLDSIFVGLLSLIIGVVSILGMVNGIRSLKEP